MRPQVLDDFLGAVAVMDIEVDDCDPRRSREPIRVLVPGIPGKIVIVT